jgi:uncharacterized membrane protein (UPF0127 family)
LDINLVNSTDGRIDLRTILGMIDLTGGYNLIPGQPYSQTMDISTAVDLLPPDEYRINVTYTNFHDGEGVYRPDNVTRYYSNTVAFTVEKPPLPVIVGFALPGNGTVEFNCELADTAQERAQGLMFRESLPQDEGMLFEFDTAEHVTFWMKNTLIPLDIIFIDADGIVANVEEADVQTSVPDDQLTRYHSNGRVLYVLEINQGLAAAHGIDTGTVSTITYLD